MKTLELSKKKTKPTFGLAFPSLSTEHGNFEYDEVEFNSCVEEESPAWHEAVLKEREEE